MGWSIQCKNEGCGKQTMVKNIVDLIKNHTDQDGWFLCNSCSKKGFIEKSFKLQESGHTWEPYLRGVIPLGVQDDTYQPFVFIVSYEPNGQSEDVWFSYYKDLRPEGGKLKLGYGPGGPPVLGASQITDLVQKLIRLGCMSRMEMDQAVRKA